jgi:fibronectin type 3 domain-containing protein
MILQFTIERSGGTEYAKVTTYQANFWASQESSDVGVSFHTGRQKQSIFLGTIGSFEEIAKLMMAANPQMAIRAFGVAMQDVPDIISKSAKDRNDKGIFKREVI